MNVIYLCTTIFNTVLLGLNGYISNKFTNNDIHISTEINDYINYYGDLTTQNKIILALFVGTILLSVYYTLYIIFVILMILSYRKYLIYLFILMTAFYSISCITDFTIFFYINTNKYYIINTIKDYICSNQCINLCNITTGTNITNMTDMYLGDNLDITINSSLYNICLQCLYSCYNNNGSAKYVIASINSLFAFNILTIILLIIIFINLTCINLSCIKNKK